MKKLSTLIALILCVTIGGVYATWYYSGNENVADVSESISINLADAENAGAHGSYTMVKTIPGNSFFRIDQMDDAHTAGLVVPEGTSVKLVFKVNANATAAIKAGNFDTWIYFTSNLDTLTYDGKQVFEAVAAKDQATGIKITWTVNAEGNLEADITEYIADAVNFANTFTLDTLAKYNDFEDVLDTAAIKVHVTDGTIETASN